MGVFIKIFCGRIREKGQAWRASIYFIKLAIHKKTSFRWINVYQHLPRKLEDFRLIYSQKRYTENVLNELLEICNSLASFRYFHWVGMLILFNKFFPD